MTPKEIIAKAVEPHFDKPHHNLMASEIVRDLAAAGFVIVPKEPTDEMLMAVEQAYVPAKAERWADTVEPSASKKIWALMLETAPPQQDKP